MTRLEVDDRRSPSSCLGRRVAPLSNERCAGENLAYRCALNAPAFAVNQTHAAKTSLARVGEIPFDDARSVPGPYRVEIEHVAQRNHDRLGKRVTWVQHHSFKRAGTASLPSA